MDARLQRRVQRYGWDLAAADYEPLWQSQLAAAQMGLMTQAALAHGERVLDVACGTGLVTFPAAQAVGPSGSVLGVDISGHMVEVAQARAQALGVSNASFARMEAEALALPDASFDVVLCALGLMYMPEPEQALREMRRVLRPGGRLVLAVWGERSACGWSPVFEIVDAEVKSEVCPLFFGLGQPGALVRACADAKLVAVEQQRIDAIMNYTDADEACRAAFIGGPVALAWSRFDEAARARACARYLKSIDAWRDGESYRVPGQFVVVAARAAP